MASVPEEVRRSVVFIGTKGQDDKGPFRPRATGFIAAIDDEGFIFLHVVTAEHVVSGLLSRGMNIWIRANVVGKSATEMQVPASAWYFHPDGAAKPTDVALCQFNVEGNDFDIRAIALNGEHDISSSPEIEEQLNIGVGDRVAVIGLFRNHYGIERNIPIVRTGHIAMLRGEPVSTKYCGFLDAHLVEMLSVGGLSGSPVFLAMDPLRAVRGKAQWVQCKEYYLFGLMHGHFDIKNLNDDVVIDADTEALGSINAGIGVVVPIDKIIETVNQPELAMARKKLISDMRRGGATADGAISDLDAGDEASPANGANPKHREDFSSLVGAAARKRAPKD